MRRNWLNGRQHERVVVYTTDHQCLEGLLVTVAKDGLVLYDATIRSDGDVSLAGHIHVARDKVTFVQVP